MAKYIVASSYLDDLGGGGILRPMMAIEAETELDAAIEYLVEEFKWERHEDECEEDATPSQVAEYTQTLRKEVGSARKLQWRQNYSGSDYQIQVSKVEDIATTYQRLDEAMEE